MGIMGTPTVHPVLFYSGKVSGYLLWLGFLFSFIPGVVQLYYIRVVFKHCPDISDDCLKTHKVVFLGAGYDSRGIRFER
jgi:hypothetical protein